ncbi:MAG TPA: hypothetical protein VHK88_20085 [Aquihabitans sp.]|jgi:hypothetical protein|nr:hypothetical protein [Aquihabitans sp.]
MTTDPPTAHLSAFDAEGFAALGYDVTHRGAHMTTTPTLAERLESYGITEPERRARELGALAVDAVLDLLGRGVVDLPWLAEVGFGTEPRQAICRLLLERATLTLDDITEEPT